MSMGKINEGDDGGAEACEEVEVGNMYGGMYFIVQVWSEAGVELRQRMSGCDESG